ncbi:hypothetical protein F383_27765 [Gossypium arboreum]|uniref:Uncharacterized protein n=1 Tax=Gossypium arboreum TaxID=29729 RepID=A0A0B0PAH4_GOSAR|nr:hypothetical protein F383_27765 [Gossypium arboreum]
MSGTKCSPCVQESRTKRRRLYFHMSQACRWALNLFK